MTTFLDTLKYIVKMPYRIARRSSIDRRLGRLPDGRGWRTAITPTLHVSIMRGMINYAYRDIPMQKHPMDMALYTRLIWETKPRTIIEIGSYEGGSAVWMADMIKSFGIDGRVVSIDIAPPTPKYTPENVLFLQGDSSELHKTLTSDYIESLPRPWLVIEDAGHHFGPTLNTLEFFHPLMRVGEYIVVEDANVTEMGVDARYDGGPARAITEFLKKREGGYEIDARYCDQYGPNVTGNTNGYLRRK
jgi:cephalosporin hydroxylase